jgi:hypothetical protein
MQLFNQESLLKGVNPRVQRLGILAVIAALASGGIIFYGLSSFQSTQKSSLPPPSVPKITR